MKSMKRNSPILWIAIVILLVGGIISSGITGVTWKTLEQQLSKFSMRIPSSSSSSQKFQSDEKVKVVYEESVVIDVVEKVSPSVVTIGVKKTRRVGDIFEFNPFDPFEGFRRRPGRTQQIEQDIGSGFIVSSDGFVVTNKHVVNDPSATYNVITKDGKTYPAKKIYRDPSNDLAIIKIDASGLTPVEMGDSNKIRVGQLAIAIGTALGEFRHTVTTGVISGVGRGITAGSPFEGYVERLDNVIQTDAAINPGNSGGPLLNSSGQVIGVNTAVSAEGQNIGFAIPINVIKESLKNFNETGQFNRPFLGIRYRNISRDVAILNEVPEGAYILEVVSGSPAETAGLQEADIITSINDTRLNGDNDLATVLSRKKVGEQIKLSVWRDGETLTITATLGSQGE
ncbi:MAG: trypsin-like peptidase domain-containing protein [Patescibacteria group bacterium]|nr:trypsin-like peptidase domain-containing protein [Patescibacteria group bacterium]